MNQNKFDAIVIGSGISGGWATKELCDMIKSNWKWILILCITASMTAQNPHDFDKEIEKFNEISITEGTELTVFTGSSSIRLWENLKEDCNHTQLVNTGLLWLLYIPPPSPPP